MILSGSDAIIPFGMKVSVSKFVCQKINVLKNCMELKLYSWRYFLYEKQRNGAKKDWKKEKERMEERKEKNRKVKSENMVQSIEKSRNKIMKDVRSDFE